MGLTTPEVVTDQHCRRLSSKMMSTEHSYQMPSDDEIEEISDGTLDGIGRGGHARFKIPDDLITRTHIQRRLRDELRKNEIPDDQVDEISNKVTDAIHDVMRDEISDIEEAINSHDDSRIETVSKLILTAIATKIINEVFNVMSQYSNEIMNAIVDTITSLF